MTPRRIRLLSLLFLLRSALAFESDFSFYPPSAQPCLDSASKASKCSGPDAKTINTCLCGNGGNFITRTAQCLGRQRKADVQAAYSTMSEACAHSGTPMTVSQQDFFDAAAGKSMTTSSATPASSATGTAAAAATATETATGTAAATAAATDPAADKNNNKPGGGLSKAKGTVIGIAVGAAAVGVLGTLVLVMVCIRRRRKQTEVESHPMLGQSDYYHNTPTTFPPSEPSPGFGHYAADQKSAWGTSPSPGLHSPRRSPAAQPGAPYAVPHHQYSHETMGIMTGHQSETHGNAGRTYELDGSSAPAPAPAPAHLAVEMEGTPPPRHSGIY
ncbi:hypothetical protein EsDP_00000696 [Epichloe bromicola]|uniref:Extracellular membrane protein CFEM domain-containing protein n=1 Tax=Epichloe bromicola TaxID=79588 RepID=A0ABQ0CFN0_9HYPO